MTRISVNKLGEYLICQDPARRRRIITDQKHPSAIIVSLYRLATEPLTTFLASGGVDSLTLDRSVVRLRSDMSGTDRAITDRRNTAEALEHFLQMAGELPWEGVKYLRGQEQAPHLNIKGVAVSVRPDYLLMFEQRGVLCVGAIKFHFRKTMDHPLGRDGGEYVATLVQRWLVEHGPAGRKVMPTHCLSIDLFRRAIVCAPNATTRRMSKITAACEEIAAQWDRL